MKSHENPHINKNPMSDSAGVPWAGRELSENTFAKDQGSADQALISAIEIFHKSLNPAEVFDKFSKARLLIPILANLGESEIGAHGQKVDKSAELSIVNVETPDGQVALPVFSSVDAMKLWNPNARPVPNDAIRVALAAASEGSTRIVLDPGSVTEFAFRRAAIAALAQQLSWQAPYLNPEVIAAYKLGVKNEPEILGIEIGTADALSRLEGAEVKIQLEIKLGLSQSELQELLNRVTEMWSSSKVIAAAVDSMALSVKPIK